MTVVDWQWLAGLCLTLSGWLATRIVARTRGANIAFVFDGLIPVAMWFMVCGLTARPVFSGVIVFALMVGLAFADAVKRVILREPVLWCDMSELIELVRHPRLYLPYAGAGRIVGGFLALSAAAAILFWLEAPAFFLDGWGIARAGLVAAGVILLPATLLLQPFAAMMRAFRPSGDPEEDTARFGSVATLLIYGLIARAERAQRRASLRPPPTPPAPDRGDSPPVVVVQSESFFDVRRLGKSLFPRALLTFEKAGKSGVSGRFATPAWGANTVRTEFEAITGIDSSRLGFDRFNPYHAFVRQPVSSLAWVMKARGYRTVCLHPYDRTFYSRHRVMKHLGFDLFVGQEVFERPPDGSYIADAVLTERIEAMLGKERQKLFIFAITMENHGPWAGGLEEFVSKLAGADAQIGALKKALRKGGVLAFYGDHLPSFPAEFAEHGFEDDDTDYLVWRLGLPRARKDIAAHELAPAVIAALDAPLGQAS